MRRGDSASNMSTGAIPESTHAASAISGVARCRRLCLGSVVERGHCEATTAAMRAPSLLQTKAPGCLKTGQLLSKRRSTAAERLWVSQRAKASAH